ncbi:MAG: helix-turn-helix domain-containing protein [Hyphomicrobiales bacterium]
MTLHLRPSASEEQGNTAFRVKPDGEIDPAGETGWFLQRERERVGKTLADAALETQINAKYLHAIEHGVLQDLPSGSYVLGYVRVYAEFLGLDPEPVIEHYKTLLPAADRKDPAAGGRGAGAVFGLAAASLAFVAGLSAIVWFILPDGSQDTAPRTAETAPASGAQAVSGDADALPTGSISPGAAVNGDVSPADREARELDQAVPTVRIQQRGLAEIDGQNAPAPGTSADSLNAADKSAAGLAATDGDAGQDQTSGLTEFIRQHVTDADAASGAETAPDGGQVFGTKEARARVILKANQSVWIRVEDEQGNVMITRTLQAGDSYRVPNRPGLVLIARDGGALDYSIDGRSIGAIGATGEIVVGRSLDIDKLRQAGG